MELDFVDLPHYIKIKLLIGDCGFNINEIEGMYLDVIGRNLLKKLYHERNIILAQSNDLLLNSLFLFSIFLYRYHLFYSSCMFVISHYKHSIIHTLLYYVSFVSITIIPDVVAPL
jgi:hypothetical protein